MMHVSFHSDLTIFEWALSRLADMSAPERRLLTVDQAKRLSACFEDRLPHLVNKRWMQVLARGTGQTEVTLHLEPSGLLLNLMAAIEGVRTVDIDTALRAIEDVDGPDKPGHDGGVRA
jgi:hypothetical protein